MNQFEMVVAIVGIVSLASVIRAKLGILHRGRGKNRHEFFAQPQTPDPEAIRLREKVKALKDRVAVLERLATDGTSALEREFEKLKGSD